MVTVVCNILMEFCSKPILSHAIVFHFDVPKILWKMTTNNCIVCSAYKIGDNLETSAHVGLKI